MNGLAIDTLVQRLERLERQHGRLKSVCAALLLAIAGILLTAQATPRPRTIEADRFYVKDASGKVRAALGVGVVLGEGTDSVGLRLFGRDGTTRIQMFLRGNDDAPFIQLRDREEKVSTQMDLAPDDTPGFNLRGPRRGLGATTSEITFSFKKELPYIQLTNKAEKVIWQAP